ncbi:MAG: flagellar biosynthesis protein FlhA [Candidatus Tectomicrobia bacterium]|nr:flagellar biosynthesis protein FlhA [Candidatus Tectomicrobia bacterium]
MATSRVSSYSGAVIAIGVIGILLLMVIPMPPFLLDAFLAFSITLSLLILLIAMYVNQPLDFSVFPSVLLLVTLFRLTLNISSTRLILLRGNEGVGAAGHVIQSFGQFVVGGNYIVGFIIFSILVIINFVVITKGAGRIAEVAARFTLDAMPGKQMSIDADLNAGLINEDEARARRRAISREAEFYGAMDGASKFVRGDAIAGIVITVINIVGGLIVGVLQHNLSLATAATNYTILTIGDGLVSQIPSLITSTAAGIVVTRAASESNLGQDIIGQLLVQPRALGVAAGVLAAVGLVPGLPQVPFLGLAAVTGGVAYFLHQRQRQAALQRAKERAAAPAQAPEAVETLLGIDVLALEIGYALIPLVDAQQHGDLLERIKSIRRQFAQDLGLVVPPIHIRDNLRLRPDEYCVNLRATEIARGELLADHYLAMDHGAGARAIDGLATTEPAFGLPAYWITQAQKEHAQLVGYTVVDASTVLATHITELIRQHAHQLLDRQAVQRLIDRLREENAKVVEELIPNLLTLGQVQKVLQNLLRERVSVRDLGTILETLADVALTSKDAEFLTECTRQALSRSITKQYEATDGNLHLLTLDPKLETTIAKAIQRTEHGSYLALEPAVAQQLIWKLSQALEQFSGLQAQPVILSAPTIRSQLKRLTERFLPNLAILSHHEVAPSAKVQTLGVVSL